MVCVCIRKIPEEEKKKVKKEIIQNPAEQSPKCNRVRGIFEPQNTVGSTSGPSNFPSLFSIFRFFYLFRFFLCDKLSPLWTLAKRVLPRPKYRRAYPNKGASHFNLKQNKKRQREKVLSDSLAVFVVESLGLTACS